MCKIMLNYNINTLSPVFMLGYDIISPAANIFGSDVFKYASQITKFFSLVSEVYK